jgi:hypothetical protein
VLAVLVALCAPVALCAQHLDTAMLAQSGAFQSLSFARLVGANGVGALEFAVEIPQVYRERRAATDMNDTLVWATPTDWGRMSHGRPASGRFGALIAQRSPSLAFNPRTGLFGDGTGLTELNLAERLTRAKARAITVRRLDRAGTPILLLEADLEKGERLRAIYVQVPRGTRALLYLAQTPWGEADQLVWARLCAGLLR